MTPDASRTPGTPPAGEPTCPDCGNALFTVTYGGGPLNRDQWESQKAGDYYCATCPGNDRGKTGLRYFWQSELAAVRSASPPPAVAPGPEQIPPPTKTEWFYDGAGIIQWRVVRDPLWAELLSLRDRLAAAESARDGLLAVIRDVHAQHADDLCWMDIDRIFAAAGLPVPDRSVGDKAAMLKNCERFVGTLCTGGNWPSYAELETRLAAAESALAAVLKDREGLTEELKLWKPLTPAEAEKAMAEAEAVPLSEERIAEMVAFATDPANAVGNKSSAAMAAEIRRLSSALAAERAAAGRVREALSGLLKAYKTEAEWGDGIAEQHVPAYEAAVAALAAPEPGR